MIGSEYPTANLFLPELWLIKEALDVKSLSSDDWVRAMAIKMQLKFDKYWGNCNLLISIAAVLDPRNKFKLIDFAYKSIYSDYEAEHQKRVLRESLYDLFKEYVEAYRAANSDSSTIVPHGSVSLRSSLATDIGKKKNGRSLYEKHLKEVVTQSSDIKSELDTYLEEGVFICEDNSSDFDALAWWKANNLKFRILSKMQWKSCLFQ